jgi:hypothetical protein
MQVPFRLVDDNQRTGLGSEDFCDDQECVAFADPHP